MSESKDKKLLFARDVSQRHWVGNGFYVHGILRPTPDMNTFISPFILMDYASPKEFPHPRPKRVLAFTRIVVLKRHFRLSRRSRA